MKDKDNKFEPIEDRDTKGDERVPLPIVGTMVHFTGENLVVYPAIVIGTHKEEGGSIDLRVQLEYAHGTHDRENVVQSDEGAPGTYMEILEPEARQEKIAAALDERAKIELQASEKLKKELEDQAKKDAKHRDHEHQLA